MFSAELTQSEDGLANSPGQAKIAGLLIVEDDPLLRARLCDGLSHLAPANSVNCASNLGAAKKLYLRHRPAAVLLDVGLPDGNGLELLLWQQAHQLSAKVLVLTGFSDEETVIQAIQLGAQGYLLKNDSQADLAKALLATMAGSPSLSPSIAQCMMRHIELQGSQQPCPLPPRQQQTLFLLARGLTYQEIADQMTIKLSTVATHAQEIYNKLSARSRSEAVFKARELGIIK